MDPNQQPTTVPGIPPEVQPPPKTSKKMIAGIAVFSLVLLGMIGYIVVPAATKTQLSHLLSTKDGLSNVQNVSSQHTELLPSSLNGLGVVYGYSFYSADRQFWNDPKRFVANLDNTARKELSTTTLATTISPQGKRFARVTDTTIETAPGNDPTVLRKIVDATGKHSLGINHVLWSKTEDTLAYELRIGTTAEYYTVNYDGTNLKMIGSIQNHPGGDFAGYDFEKQIIYATLNDFYKNQEILVALDTQTNTQNELLSLPIDTGVLFSKDYRKVYYPENTTLVEFDPATNQKKTIFDTKTYGNSQPLGIGGIRISHENNTMSIQTSTDNKKGYIKYLLNTQTGTAEVVLNEPRYSPLAFVPSHTFSPDNRYIFLSSTKESIDPEKPGFYSGSHCIWDTHSKKVIPFFNCAFDQNKNNRKINEDMGFVGWIENVESVTFSNNTFPSPTPTPQPKRSTTGSTGMDTRNVVRKADLQNLMRALVAYKKDKNSVSPAITTSPQNIAKAGADICSSLVPVYIATLPKDPSLKPGGPSYIQDCNSNYDTGYTIAQSADGTITLSAPNTEIDPIISLTE